MANAATGCVVRRASFDMRQPLFVFVLLTTCGHAMAQMVLPGAVAPTPAGAPGAPASSPHKTGPAKAKSARHGEPEGKAAPAPAKVLPATALAGQTLYLNGRQSQISFELRDKALVVSHLTLTGQTDGTGEDCRIDVADLPLKTSDLGQPDGMSRIGLAFPACPITFDVLADAALANADRPSCDFEAAKCNVAPNGLWGPQVSTFGADRDKTIERERARAEAAVRSNFKRLLTTTKDRPTIMGYARDQAQFSSTREEVCQSYVGETKHGFCSTRLTEARAAAVRAKADVEQALKEQRKKKRHAKS